MGPFQLRMFCISVKDFLCSSEHNFWKVEFESCSGPVPAAHLRHCISLKCGNWTWFWSLMIKKVRVRQSKNSPAVSPIGFLTCQTRVPNMMRGELGMFFTTAFVNPHSVCIRIPTYLSFSKQLESAVIFFSFNEMFCSTASPFVSCPLMKLPCWWWQIFSTDHQIAFSQEKMQFRCTITALASVFLWFIHVNATKKCGFTGHRTQGGPEGRG